MLTWLVTQTATDKSLSSTAPMHRTAIKQAQPARPPSPSSSSAGGDSTQVQAHAQCSPCYQHTHTSLAPYVPSQPIQQPCPGSQPSQVPSRPSLPCWSSWRFAGKCQAHQLWGDADARFPGSWHHAPAGLGSTHFLSQWFRHQVPSKSPKAPVAGTRTPTGYRAPTPLVWLQSQAPDPLTPVPSSWHLVPAALTYTGEQD